MPNMTRNNPWLALLLLCSLLVGLLGPAVPAAAAPAPPFAVVGVPPLNVRAAPATTATLLGQVTVEERVTVLGRNEYGAWLRVETARGVSGWIFAEMAQPSVPVTALPVVQAGTEGGLVAGTQFSNPPIAQPAEDAPATTRAAIVETVQEVAYWPVEEQGLTSTVPLQPLPNQDPKPVEPAVSSGGQAGATAELQFDALGGEPTSPQPVCLPSRLRTVNLGGRPQAMAATVDRLYVTLADLNSLMIVDAGTDMMLGSSRTTARDVSYVAADDQALYVVDRGENRLLLTSRQGALLQQIDLPASPGPVAVTDGRAFVLHPLQGAVSVVDLNTATVISTLSLGRDPRQIAVIGGRAFIGHNAGFLSVVDGYGRRHEQLFLPVSEVTGMAANRQAGILYLASAANAKVVAVDVTSWTLANTWALEVAPGSLAYNDITDHLFVLDTTSQYLTVLSGSRADPAGGQTLGQVQINKQPNRPGGSLEAPAV